MQGKIHELCQIWKRTPKNFWMDSIRGLITIPQVYETWRKVGANWEIDVWKVITYS